MYHNVSSISDLAFDAAASYLDSIPNHSSPGFGLGPPPAEAPIGLFSSGHLPANNGAGSTEFPRENLVIGGACSLDKIITEFDPCNGPSSNDPIITESGFTLQSYSTSAPACSFSEPRESTGPVNAMGTAVYIPSEQGEAGD